MTSGKVTTVAFENWASKMNICMGSSNVATFEIAFNFKTEKSERKTLVKMDQKSTRWTTCDTMPCMPASGLASSRTD